jgi:gentisate 1,2-dioxygenase
MPDTVARDSDVQIVNVSGTLPAGPDDWPAAKVSAERIAETIDKLAALERPDNGKRAAMLVHPRSSPPGLGLAPGVDVTINVLKPGERTAPLQRNSSQIEICIGGSGEVCVGDRSFALAKWDACNIPSMAAYRHHNSGNDLWVRLTYSNAPLLAKLGVHYFNTEPVVRSSREGGTAPAPQLREYNRHSAPDIQISPSGARLRGYEFLTDIEVAENFAHHWPWVRVSEQITMTLGDNKRRIILLYNPATGRRNGTSHSFFLTCASVPPGAPPRKVARGHRHSSVAINYHYKGSGFSVVGDQKIDWKAGDLLLSAPGWREHAHYAGLDGSGTFTVQDHPLHIAMESLIWQERMDGPILTLGSEAGQIGYVGPRVPGD